MPLLKKGVSSLGREALSTGVSIAKDALEGKNIKMAAKTRLGQAGRNLTDNAIRILGSRQTGGRRRQRTIKRKAKSRRSTSLASE